MNQIYTKLFSAEYKKEESDQIELLNPNKRKEIFSIILVLIWKINCDPIKCTPFSSTSSSNTHNKHQKGSRLFEQFLLPREKKKHHATGTQIKIQEKKLSTHRHHDSQAITEPYTFYFFQLTTQFQIVTLVSIDNFLNATITRHVLYNRVWLFLKQFSSHKCFKWLRKKNCSRKRNVTMEFLERKTYYSANSQHSFFIVRKLKYFIKNCHL